MSGSKWRKMATPIITEVIKRVGIEDKTLLRKELKAAYPFGIRANHPYKIWLDEIKRQIRWHKFLQESALLSEYKR